MDIKVTVSLDGETLERLAKVLGKEIIAPAAEEEPKKRGRKPKAEVLEEDEDEAAEEEAEEEDAEEDADEESEDDEDAEDEDAEEDDVISPEDLVKLKKALRKYSDKFTKEKAVKILNKFAKASQDVKAADVGKLMKLLKA